MEKIEKKDEKVVKKSDTTPHDSADSCHKSMSQNHHIVEGRCVLCGDSD